MSNTASDQAAEAPPSTEPTPTIPSYNIFVSFHYEGEDNGVPKSGFDSRVLNVPDLMPIASGKEIKDIAEALAKALFIDGKKFVGLHLTLINIQRLPV